MDIKEETIGAMAAKVAPPASVSVATIAGIEVSDILLWTTLVYTIVLLAHKLWTWYNEWQLKKNRKEDCVE